MGSSAMARGLLRSTSTTVVQTVRLLLHNNISCLVSSRKYQLSDDQSSASWLTADNRKKNRTQSKTFHNQSRAS